MKIELASAQIVDLSTYFLVFENCIKICKSKPKFEFCHACESLEIMFRVKRSDHKQLCDKGKVNIVE